MDTDFYKDIIPLLKEKLADKNVPIKIFCPYLTKAAEDILFSVNPEYCEIYTRLNIMDLLAGSSDINTLIKIHKKGFKLFEIDGLHAKVVLVEDVFAVVGSQNLTTKSRYNKELTAVFSGSAEIDKISKCVEIWMSQKIEITEASLDKLSILITELKPKFQKLIEYSHHQQLERMANSLITKTDSLLAQLVAHAQDCRRFSKEINLTVNHVDIQKNIDEIKYCVQKNIKIYSEKTQIDINKFESVLQKLENDIRSKCLSDFENSYTDFSNDFGRLVRKKIELRKKSERIAKLKFLEKENDYNGKAYNFYRELNAIRMSHFDALKDYRNCIREIQRYIDNKKISNLNECYLAEFLDEVSEIQIGMSNFFGSYRHNLKKLQEDYIHPTNIKNIIILFQDKLNVEEEIFANFRIEANESYCKIIEFAKKIVIKKRQAALNELEIKLQSLGIFGRVPEQIAKKLVEQSDWWLTQKYRPVRARKNAKNLKGDQRNWYIRFGRNRFLVTKSILGCQKTLRKFIIQINSGILQSEEKLFEELRLNVQKSVANHSTGRENLEPYELGKSSGSYSGIEKHMVFGSHSIDTDSFIKELLKIIDFDSYKQHIWQEPVVA